MTRTTAALELALDAFWTTFTQQFPEAKTGDIDPVMVARLEVVAEEAGCEWIMSNVPGGLRAVNDSPELDASVARHPAGKRLAGPCSCDCNSGGFCGGCGHAGCGGRR